MTTAAPATGTRSTLPTLDGAERERELLDALKVAYAVQQRARANREDAIRALDETAVESAAADTAVEQLNGELSAHLRGSR